MCQFGFYVKDDWNLWCEATNDKVKGEEVIIGDPQIDNDGSNNGGYEDGGDSFGREESKNSGVRLEW